MDCGVTAKYWAYAACLWCVLFTGLMIFTVFQVKDAVTSQAVYQEEVPEYGSLPNIVIDSAVGIVSGKASIFVPGSKKPKLTVSGRAMVGQPSGLPGPPPCKCNGEGSTSKVFFELADILPQLKGDDLVQKTAKFKIQFDVEFFQGPCNTPPALQGKCPTPALQVTVPGPAEMNLGYGTCEWKVDQDFFWEPAEKTWDCCPSVMDGLRSADQEQCPMRLTTVRKMETGWPTGFDFYLFKRYRGQRTATAQWREAHYRFASASVGSSVNENKMTFGVKVDTTTIDVTLIESVLKKLTLVGAEFGGYYAVIICMFGIIFVPRYPRLQELTLVTTEEEDVLPGAGGKYDLQEEGYEEFEDAGQEGDAQ